MIRVLLVDDHPVVRRGLRAMVDDLPDVTAVGEAADGAEALEVLAGLDRRPDVVLMDLQMGTGMHGVEATRRITALPDPPAVL
ncbi:response regulator transcription factor, partial [Kitasatospora sp. MBT63]